MHKRTTSQKLISRGSDINTDNSFSPYKFPEIASTRVEISSRKIHTSHTGINRKTTISLSPVKNFEFIVNRCETELKKIRKISTKLKKSARKLKQNQNLINKIIYKPLYSYKVLIRDRPKFLTKNFKYESFGNA